MLTESVIKLLKNEMWEGALIITPEKVIVTTPGADNKKEL